MMIVTSGIVEMVDLPRKHVGGSMTIKYKEIPLLRVNLYLRTFY